MFTCVVLHNLMRTHQVGADRAPTPGNNVAVQQNEHEVYVPNENYSNLLREGKMKDYFNHVGTLTGQEDRI